MPGLWGTMTTNKEFVAVRKVIEGWDAAYRRLLDGLDKHKDFLERFEAKEYDNGFWPLLDVLGMLAVFENRKPKTFLEIGCGNSTKWARRISDYLELDLNIVCVDPEPRVDVLEVASSFEKRPAQDLPVEWYVKQFEGHATILSIDTSHYCDMSNEGPFLFLDLLPALPWATWVQVHDQFLPWDYPTEWNARRYHETYLCALLLLGREWRATLPVYYASQAQEINSVFDPLWKASPFLAGLPRDGGSLWLQKLGAP